MKIEPLSLDHQSILKPKFQAMALELSEYSFASRYLFRFQYNFEVLDDDRMLWLRGRARDGSTYLMPTEDFSLIPYDYLLAMQEWAGYFYPIPERWIASLAKERFYITFERSDSDYLFKTEKIAHYSGRKLSAKRNLVKQFSSAYRAEILPYSRDRLEDALTVLISWQETFQGYTSDFVPCQEGLLLADQLGLQGYMVYIDKQPAAFILGEVLHSTLFDIHFAKGLIKYKGIYPFLFKELANKFTYEEVRYLNWEQDLGEEGLRKSKLSYQPELIAHKYRVFPLQRTASA
ncbi:MAG: DUF2156 domain-containing protein [Parachlamydiaceae bacterium]